MARFLKVHIFWIYDKEACRHQPGHCHVTKLHKNASSWCCCRKQHQDQAIATMKLLNLFVLSGFIMYVAWIDTLILSVSPPPHPPMFEIDPNNMNTDGKVSDSFLMKNVPLPSLSATKLVSDYHLENPRSQCHVINDNYLDAMWTYSGNATAPDLYLSADVITKFSSEKLPEPQNVSTEYEQRYILKNIQLTKHVTAINLYVHPCAYCDAHLITCEPKLRISWFPFWASIDQLDRLIFEGRLLHAYWGLFLMFIRWSFMLCMLIQMHWSLTGRSYWFYGIWE
ncbi:Rh189 [macacine betaherpesvirus 3]|nr:Rh189 [macacine betaherpesvirus 3]